MTSGPRTICIAVASTCLITGCLFPSLDGLSTPLETIDSGTTDEAATEAGNEAATEAGDAAAPGCPDASDPTLLAYYRFDEGTGITVSDCSSYGRTAKMILDAGSWTTGKVGSALLVSSAGNGSGCVGVSLPIVLNALTVAAWVRVDKAPAPDLPGFIVDQSFNLNSEGWRASVDQSGKDYALSLGGIGDAGLDQFGSNTSYALGVWTYVVMTVDPGGQDAIYINGVLDTTKTAPNAIVHSNADLRVGCRGDGAITTYFDGAIDEVRLYNRALSGTEIASLYVP